MVFVGKCCTEGVYRWGPGGPDFSKIFHVYRNRLGSLAKYRSRVEVEPLRFCSSNRFPGDADAADQRMTL